MTLDSAAEPAHRRPRAAPVERACLEFDLGSEVDRLRHETTWLTGRSAKTLLKHDDLRVVLTVLQARTRIAEDTTAGRISIHLLSGHIRLNASGRVFDLRPGSLVALDQGTAHDMEALEESAFLITIAWPGP